MRVPQTVAIIGTGLIGASIGLALRKRQRAVRVIGWDRNKDAARKALRRGAVARIATNFPDAVESADVIVLAAPTGAIPALLRRTLARAHRSALVLDVAGVKSPIVRSAEKPLRAASSASFVAGHPMAGSEKSGAQHADANLFESRPFVLYAPPQRSAKAALARASAFARRLGAYPIVIKPDLHDQVVAATSGLPQFASIALAHAVARGAGRNAAKLAGPGVRDSLRLAGSPYALWRDAVAMNSANLVRALRQFDRTLHGIIKAVARRDDRFLGRSFERSASIVKRVLRPPGTRRRRH